MKVNLIQGDCLDILRGMEAESVDAVVTDPPYFLHFMGRKWDHAPTPKEQQRQHEAWAVEVFRVLKPGAHLLAFGGTRTYHRMTCAIEDAGFEIRDSIQWVYGSGFPKSLNAGKAMYSLYNQKQRAHGRIPKAGTETMCRHAGLGTALKPAHEPIVLARKPLSEKSVAGQVLSSGTGAINVDGCRVGSAKNVPASYGSKRERDGWGMDNNLQGSGGFDPNQGRWPPNLLLTHHPDCVLESGSQPTTMRVCQDDDTNSHANTAARSESPHNTPSSGFATGSVEGLPDGDELTTPTATQTRRDTLGSNTGTTNSESMSTSLNTEGSGEKPDEKFQADTLSTTSTTTRQTTDSETSNSCHEGRTDGSTTGTTRNTPMSQPRPITTAAGERTTPNTKPSTLPENGSVAAADDSRARCVPGCPILEMDEQSGTLKSGTGAITKNTQKGYRPNAYGADNRAEGASHVEYGDSGGASRFFPRFHDFDAELLAGGSIECSCDSGEPNFHPDTGAGFKYQAKSSRAERNKGLEGMPEKPKNNAYGNGLNSATKVRTEAQEANGVDRGGTTNNHPTVKPLALMDWLITLITPPGGVVLDPFCGSGSTGCSAARLGFYFIGIEMDEEYAEIARRRIAYWSQPEAVRARDKGKAPAKNRSTYGFKSTKTLPRCEEHDTSLPSGQNSYACGCPIRYIENGKVPAPEPTDLIEEGRLF